ncbi:MAG TPA: hypothetical protein VLX60_09330 [Terriglobales bacterium]|nr:hypothetical protein [Terriglobales bacterium]
MKIRAGLLVCASALLFTGSAAFAQSSAAPSQGASASAGQVASEKDIQLLREDIRSKKKQLIAANLNLTDTEATKFWPVYDQYTAELVQINNDKYAVIKEYADNWGTMTDAQALNLLHRSLEVDAKVAALRAKYVPIINKVLPGTKTATFFQMDRRIGMMIDLQLSSKLPLVQDQN